MRKDIKKILNPALVEKWNKNKNGSLNGIVFNKGDLVSMKGCDGRSLGIVIEQDGVMAIVQWTEQPDDLRVFDKKTFVSSLKLVSGVNK
jgi:signal recognition particle GTPase